MPLGLKIHGDEYNDLPIPWWTYYVLKCAPKFCVDELVGGGIEANTVFMGMVYTVVEGTQFDLKIFDTTVRQSTNFVIRCVQSDPSYKNNHYS